MSESTSPEGDLASRALSIAKALAHASPGEKAEARRMDPSGAPVFWRQVARLGIKPYEEANWMQYTRLVALLTPASRDSSIHGPLKLGAALARAGFSEQRLARLLAARGPARDEALERAIRMLSRKVEVLDLPDLAHALFWPEDGQRLARAYYSELDHTPAEEPQA